MRRLRSYCSRFICFERAAAGSIRFPRALKPCVARGAVSVYSSNDNDSHPQSGASAARLCAGFPSLGRVIRTRTGRRDQRAANVADARLPRHRLRRRGQGWSDPQCVRICRDARIRGDRANANPDACTDPRDCDADDAGRCTDRIGRRESGTGDGRDPGPCIGRRAAAGVSDSHRADQRAGSCSRAHALSAAVRRVPRRDRAR